MPYNATIALALRYALQIGTPTTETKPPLATVTELWADATAQTAAAFRAARLADGASELTGLALQRAKELEALYLGAAVLLAKGSIGKDAKSTSPDLSARAAALAADLVTNREMWIAEGADEEGTRANPYVKSQQIDDADPDFDFTAGTGDIPYAENDVWPFDGDSL